MYTPVKDIELQPILKDKSNKVKNIFRSIANRYDRANKAITFGMDSQWRANLVRWSAAPKNGKVLDCATGTGALAFTFAKHLSSDAQVVGIDFCSEMLQEAQKLGKNISQVRFQMADIHHIPFLDNMFDVSAMAYGLRNVEDPIKVLREMARVTKLGGVVMILETGSPAFFLYPFYYLYCRFIMPWIGGWVTGQRSAYNYLQQSSMCFPSRRSFLKLLDSTGCFDDCQYKTLFFGASFIYKARVKSL